MQKKDNNQPEEKKDKMNNADNSDIKTESEENSAENADNAQNDKKGDLEEKVKELNDKYLRLYSEFDNYRKRTMKEKADIIKTAGEDILNALLPIIDDFERAIKATETVDDAAAVKEGVHLIYNKLKNATQQKGLVAFESIGKPFDSDVMEAITHVPAQDESQKGKVIDEVEKGYKLGDKVIRFAKVIVAQ